MNLFAVLAKSGLTYATQNRGFALKAPVYIHPAPPGTHERSIGDNQSPASSPRRLRAASFPLCLAPDQVRVITNGAEDGPALAALMNYAKDIAA